MTVYTRSMNPDLYKKMRKLIPYDVQCIQVPGFNRNEDCSQFLHYVISISPDPWVVIIDEDCFIYNWKRVEHTIKEMKKGDFVYAGMPDGGVCSTRARSWVAMNPFFLILNTEAINELYSSRTQVDYTLLPKDIDKFKPTIVTKAYDHSLISPFNGLFNWLFKNFKPMWLPALDHSDGISTILDNFALHAWYSREYNNDPEQKQRIDNLFRETKHLSHEYNK